MTTYTHKPSLRKVTDEQFSDGTTIDADRMEIALDNLVDRVNAVPRGDVSTRYVQSQYVFGFTPWPYGEGTFSQGVDAAIGPSSLLGFVQHFPWLFDGNASEVATEHIGGPAVEVSNPWRMKGNYLEGEYFDLEWQNTGTNWYRRWYGGVAPGPNDFWLTTRLSGMAPRQIMLNQSYFFESPIIIDDLMVMFRNETDHAGFVAAYKATFAKAAGRFKGTDSATIEILVDNSFAGGDRSKSEVVLYKGQFSLEAFIASAGADAIAEYDMYPKFGVNAATESPLPEGRLIRLRNLDIHVKANARVHFRLSLPWLTTQAANRAEGWAAAAAGPLPGIAQGAFPVFDWALEGCLTILREVTRG